MGNVTKSQQNNITSPNGNSLAVFVDGITGIMKVKDIMGNIQPLSDFISANGTSPFEYNANATGIQPILGTNDASGCFSSIVGGYNNSAQQLCAGFGTASIGGGSNNTICADFGGAISGGFQNVITGGGISFIGGGGINEIAGGGYYNGIVTGRYNCVNGNTCYSSIGGGSMNTASASETTIGGGKSNTASGCLATIGGGSNNTASGYCSTIGGGQQNTASCYGATVGGGRLNTSSEYFATVGGGYFNTASCNYATVGGGRFNVVSNCYGTIGGGICNTTSGGCSTIGGGCCNTVSAFSTVGGGVCNTASNTSSTVGGGSCNCASNPHATVGGGYSNNASGCRSTIGGGRSNTAFGCCSTVGGGTGNNASFNFATIGGGKNNRGCNLYATVGGGLCNIASGCNSSILGGQCNNTCDFANAMIVGSNLCATQVCTTFTNCLSADNLTVGCAVSVGANKVLVNATPKIGSFFSTQTQSATTINTPKAMTLNNTDAFSSGVSIVSNSQITVDTTGIYNLQFSAQIDRLTTSGVDRMEIWLRKQGVDIPNSTGKVTVSGTANQAKLIASWNFYVSLTAGQYVELMYSVTDLQVQIVTEAENLVVPYPATPSLIVTIQKIN